MTMVKETNIVAKYQVTQQEFNKLEQWDRSNKNKLFKNENYIDHCTLPMCDGVFILVTHGSKEGKVLFDNKLVNLPELEVCIRQEQNLSFDKDIVIKLICCHDYYVGTYISEHCWIANAFNTHNYVQYCFYNYMGKNYSRFKNLAYA